jgi:sugar fermentation stimulation protein A
LTPSSCKLFDRSGGLYEASFVERPNRFLVRCDLDGALVEAHCPNPGRLLEILLPGMILLLQKRPGRPAQGRHDGAPPAREHPDQRRTAKRRLEYSLVAARHGGAIIPLASARANEVAEKIVLPMLFPEARTMRREVTLGSSRLDFLLELEGRRSGREAALHGRRDLFLEVKACTLVEEGTAMFPDAPTLRGLKHLGELEALAGQGRGAGVLFLVMNPQARRFVPNLHTDPAFTRKLLGLSGKIWMRAVSIRTAEDGSATVADPDVPIDLAAAAPVQEDGGVYLLVAKLPQGCRLTAGSLGEIRLQPGWYVYAGSGRKNLAARISRHHRRRKKLHWHIDYLLAHVRYGDLTSLPIRNRHDLECSLAQEVGALAAGSVPGFGCSDCACPSHLARFDHDPLQDRRFLDLLLHYRHTLALSS